MTNLKRIQSLSVDGMAELLTNLCQVTEYEEDENWDGDLISYPVERMCWVTPSGKKFSEDDKESALAATKKWLLEECEA